VARDNALNRRFGSLSHYPPAPPSGTPTDIPLVYYYVGAVELLERIEYRVNHGMHAAGEWIDGPGGLRSRRIGR